MLPAPCRLRRSAEFSATARGGRRSATPTCVLSIRLTGEPTPPRVGFAVGRTVGPAVVRNRVRRRLRHLVADRLARLPDGARVVVRALPPASTSDAATLGADLDRGLDRLLAPALRGESC